MPTRRERHSVQQQVRCVTGLLLQIGFGQRGFATFSWELIVSVILRS